MKRWLFFVAALVFIAACTTTFLYAQSSYNQNSPNQYTAPQGYGSSQLQGQTPYRSNSGLRSNESSSTLSSFMRNSSRTGGLAQYLSNETQNPSGIDYPPYNTSPQTVTSGRERAAASAYTSPAYSGTLQNRTNLQTQYNQPEPGSVLPYENQYDPYTMQVQNRMVSSSVQSSSQAAYDSDEIARRLQNITERLDALQQKLEAGNYNSDSASSDNMQRYMTRSPGNNVTSGSELYSGIDENPSSDYLMRNMNPNAYQAPVSSSAARMDQQQYQPGSFASMSQQPSYDSLNEIKQKLDELSRSIDSQSQRRQNNAPQYDKVQSAQPSARPAGQSTSFRSYSQSQFDMYFRTAQGQLRTGQYNDAADSFMLACVYEPDNPFCYAGQGHALFAAGQYVNSALLIIRAIELNPDYVQASVNLAAVTGRSDIIASRTAELEQLLRKAPATGLQFLLAYVYYRTGRLPEARQVINALYQETPQSRAALALKIAVDAKLNKSN